MSRQRETVRNLVVGVRVGLGTVRVMVKLTAAPGDEGGVHKQETGCAVSRSPKGGEEEIAWAL